MLKVNNIDVYYGAIHAIKDVSLEVPDGEIVTLIGSNGAGKSTTLHTISGLIKPKNGSIIFPADCNIADVICVTHIITTHGAIAVSIADDELL